MIGSILFITIPILVLVIIGILSIKNSSKSTKNNSTFEDNDNTEHGVNPANGLPTINGIDTYGNPSGSDFNDFGIGFK